MYHPESTYRIQFHKDFTFRHLEAVIPYLHQLGIKTIYASPIFDALPGSMHGYDGIDPNRINPEIGTWEQLVDIAAGLRQRGMGWIQDFVPNHMAFSPQNPWLCDFMEKGKMSEYDAWFDKNPDEPLMAPFLGAPLETVLEEEGLKLVFSRGKLQLRYDSAEYPLNYTAYHDILAHELFDGLSLAALRDRAAGLSQITEEALFRQEWKAMLDMLNRELAAAPDREAMFQRKLDEISRDLSFLKRILDQQFYRLCYWKETNTKINYRRFFTINGLIGMQMQRPEVFEAYHRLLFRMLREDIVQGVRIDHIDGLYDPAAYLEQLRRHAGPDVYIVVEKILAPDEALPAVWPVQGTTGYDFLAQVNQVLTLPAAAAYFSEAYLKMSGEPAGPEELLYRYKEQILTGYMQGELDNLQQTFRSLQGGLPDGVTEEAMRTAWEQLLVCFPVYRFYGDRMPPDAADAARFTELVGVVRRRNKVPGKALDYLLHTFLDERLAPGSPYAGALLHLWRRCMQLSGPLMAKGLEDTLMYAYHPLIGLNEVGGTPAVFGMDVSRFHERMQERLQDFPLSMNATATHDTKRGEDARARLQLLAAHHSGWFRQVKSWLAQSAHRKFEPLSQTDRYFVLQVVYAALSTDESAEDFGERLQHYLQKAAREAKQHSSWEAPNPEYETLLVEYALTVADARGSCGQAIRKYLKQMQPAIIANSLAQLTLKCLCPGVPDIYQGTEYWDLSFVDPDNRRPVDYGSRQAALSRIAGGGTDAAALMAKPESDIKLFTLYHLLQLRRLCPGLFASGSYEPVAVPGCLSFLRRYGPDWLWVVVPLGGRALRLKQEDLPALPPEAPVTWKHVFTGAQFTAGIPAQLRQALQSYPVMVATARVRSVGRAAGILMPLNALPSPFGIGVMGEEAYRFIDFLARSGQKIWQLLPLNPVVASSYYSPYASPSAFAGEPMYIDPAQLCREGLLSSDDVEAARMPAAAEINYQEVQAQRNAMLHRAWSAFKEKGAAAVKNAFARFRQTEAGWLSDYTLFRVLKLKWKDKPWYDWPQPYRDREPEAMRQLNEAEADAIAFEAWQQFYFRRQWQRLKLYAAQRNIQLIGDIPFYMNADAADVWAARDLFSLDREGKPAAVAGVPPDYFSATGQRWGMPTYRWEAMEQDNFSWWIRRLQKNLELFDQIRLDHFRAFYDYWEIPADAGTAAEGRWLQGPKDRLFRLIQSRFPRMPFLAEDLGDLHQAVFDFKDQYRLPGMRVLQFGFSPYEGSLRDLPHNFTTDAYVYTGTHDNNTLLGWYRELDKNARASLNAYTGHTITQKNVADTLCRMAYASVAATAIVPLQDLLGLGASARINTPATTRHNWRWRLHPGLPDNALADRLRRWVSRYNR